MIHAINKPSYGGNVVMKIDMAKAYDSVDWDFLLHIVRLFGFSKFFCSLIRQCVTSPWFSMVMNSIPKGFFKGGRGLPQGDPILPYLFILVEEILTRMIKKQVELGKIVSFYHPRGTPIISHMLYTDDIVLFSNESNASLRTIMNVLKTYEDWSRQVVNKSKSSIFFLKHNSLSRQPRLIRNTGFTKGCFSFSYLGVPIVTGRLLNVHFEGMLNKIHSRLELADETLI